MQVQHIAHRGALVFAAILGVTVCWSSPAQAAVVHLSYDGTYDPYSATPPSGQTTWDAGGATIFPSPNNPTPGLAAFNDPDNNRITVRRAFTNATTVHDQEYSFEIRLRVNGWGGSITNQAPFMFGVRSEHGPDGTDTTAGSAGKFILLGFQKNYNGGSTGPGLRWQDHAVNTTTTSNANGTAITAFDFFDGEFHTFRVDKFLDGAVFKVQLYIDGAPFYATPLNYSDFGNSVANAATRAEGFGYFGSSTNHTSDVTVDYFWFGELVPEPTGMGLLGCCIFFAPLLRRREM